MVVHCYKAESKDVACGQKILAPLIQSSHYAGKEDH